MHYLLPIGQSFDQIKQIYENIKLEDGTCMFSEDNIEKNGGIILAYLYYVGPNDYCF